LSGLDDEPVAASAPEPAPESDVLEVTEAIAAPKVEAASFRIIDATQDLVLEPPPRAEPVEAALINESESLLSASTSAAVNSAFGLIAHSMMVTNSKTLEDLGKEMLRPMLKAWFDNNLPTLVERLVRAEIERVARGLRG